MMRSFASDNNAGIHPEVLAALTAANEGSAPSYGYDRWTEEANELFDSHFGGGIEVAYAFNGTGANVIALTVGTRQGQGILCSNIAHINVDEGGAPEVFVGSKLLDVAHGDGKVHVADVTQQLHNRGNRHRAQLRMISVTQATEYGTLYSEEEIRALCDVAHQGGLLVHMDGARLANAAVTQRRSLRAASRDLGIDVLSFGGTKNGLMCGEAIVVFNQELFGALAYVQKQAAQLPSKMRFISAQFAALLRSDLWHRNASRANQLATKLAEEVKRLGIEVTREVEANAVFARLGANQIARLRERYSFYVWDESSGEVRWMTSFATKEEEIDEFVALLRSIVE